MALRLIGAGLPRTGTTSRREALRHLLGEPVYHMSEAFAHPEHALTWVAAIAGDPPVWHRSMDATVLQRARPLLIRDDDDPMVLLFRAMFAGIFTDPDDPGEVMTGYERWLSEVRAGIAPERLTEWQPGDGWAPICRALGVAIPNLPFPHENSTADYLARAKLRDAGR